LREVIQEVKPISTKTRCIRRNPTKGIERNPVSHFCNAFFCRFVAFEEIPQRELRGNPFPTLKGLQHVESCIRRNPTKGIESLEHLPASWNSPQCVAFEEIPQRELRAY